MLGVIYRFSYAMSHNDVGGWVGWVGGVIANDVLKKEKLSNFKVSKLMNFH